MHSTHNSARDTPSPRVPGLWGWLNRRTGLDNLLRSALDEPIPGGARFAYIFGSALLFIFISQVITGIFLALYYVPSADHAHTTVAYITKAVTAGAFLRTLHAYGASRWSSSCSYICRKPTSTDRTKAAAKCLGFLDARSSVWSWQWRSPVTCSRGIRRLILPPLWEPTPSAKFPGLVRD